MACTRSPVHRKLRETASNAFAEAAPIPWLELQWNDLLTWLRSANQNLQNDGTIALRRLAIADPEWLLPRLHALLASLTVRDNMAGVRLLFRPPFRRDLAKSLETLLSVASNLKLDQAQDVGLRIEGELMHWGHAGEPSPPPLSSQEMQLWLDFLERCLPEAPQLYFIGRQDRSLLLTTIRAGCESAWPRPLVDMALSRFRANPESHLGKRNLFEWFNIFLAYQFWQEAEILIKVAEGRRPVVQPAEHDDAKFMRGRLVHAKASRSGVVQTEPIEPPWPNERFRVDVATGWLRIAQAASQGIPVGAIDPGPPGLKANRWRTFHLSDLTMASVTAFEALRELPAALREPARQQVLANAAFLARPGYWPGWRDHDRWVERNARQQARLGLKGA